MGAPRSQLIAFLLLQCTAVTIGFVSIQPVANRSPLTKSRIGSRTPLPSLQDGRASVDSSSSSIGKSQESNFEWTSEWYPVSPEQDLSLDTPNKITLLGMDFVVWFHEPSGQWRGFADACPHRLAPLSEGRIASNGLLQCAYHGWEFDQGGGCVRIPQLGSSEESSNTSNTSTNKLVQSPRACATSFPVRIEQGLLWIFPNTDETLAKSKEPALIAELDDPENVDGTNFFVRDMPYSWDILVENLCDPAHIPFAHHSFMRGADRNKESQQIDMTVIEETSQGFRARKDPYPAGNGKYDVKFQAPCLVYYYIANSSALGNDSEDPKKTNSFIGIGQYCIPTAPGRCRLIARFPMRLSVKPAMAMIRRTPRWITHFDQNIIMDSDVVLLCSQDEHLANNNKSGQPNYYMPAGSDTMVSAFRKWLASAGGKQPKWLGIPAARSSGEPIGWIRPQFVPVREGRDALLDRYRQHTDICSSCRRAHKSLYLIREILAYSGVLLLVAAASIVEKKTRIALAVASGLSLIAPRLLLRPIIARLECVPWPRKKWLAFPTRRKLRKVEK